MTGGLRKKLVVPEADASVEELRGGLQERGAPQDVVEPRFDAPGAEGVEKDRRGVPGFVGVELVEEVVAGLGGIHEARQFLAQGFDLTVGENADTREVAVLVKKGDLFGRQFSAAPGAERAERLVDLRQVADHGY